MPRPLITSLVLLASHFSSEPAPLAVPADPHPLTARVTTERATAPFMRDRRGNMPEDVGRFIETLLCAGSTPAAERDQWCDGLGAWQRGAAGIRAREGRRAAGALRPCCGRALPRTRVEPRPAPDHVHVRKRARLQAGAGRGMRPSGPTAMLVLPVTKSVMNVAAPVKERLRPVLLRPGGTFGAAQAHGVKV